MTEQEWLACTDSQPMLEFLRSRPNLGRKRRLLAVACCRRILKWMPGDSQRAFEVAERLADALATEEERRDAWIAAEKSKVEAIYYPISWATDCACKSVEAASHFDNPTSSDNDSASWVALNSAEASAWGKSECDEAILSAEQKAIADLVRCIFGNPFRPVAVDPTWLIPTVTALARIMYDDRSFDQMPDLADALEAAGCTNEEILGHCRGPSAHVRGCWVVDLVLGRE